MENQGFADVVGLRNSAEPQNLRLSWAPVWGTKIIENSVENKWFEGAMGLRNSAEPQNLSLSWASIWGARIIS